MFGTPKWNDFQDYLSRILKMSIVVLDPGGNPISMHNCSLYGYGDALSNSINYSTFFKQVPVLSEGPGWSGVVFNPLGLMTGIITLAGGEHLVLGKGLDKDAPRSRISFKENALELDLPLLVEESETENSDLEAFREKISHINSLYTRVVRSADESSMLGQRAVLLSAVEEISKLMVHILTPDDFNLDLVLEMVASSLIILTSASGAWVFSHHSLFSQTRVVIKGLEREQLTSLQDRWLAAVKHDQNPVKMVENACRELESKNMKADTLSIEKPNSFVSLGVLGTGESDLLAVFSSLAHQVTIAVEVSSLYETLQKQIAFLLNSVRQGILISNLDQEVMMVNQAAMEILGSMGIKLQVGKAFMGNGLGRSLEEALRRAITEGVPCIKKQAVMEKEDRVFYLNWDICPLRHHNNLISGAILIFEDVTDTVQLYLKAQDWERIATVGEVAASLAHEIRNPLATADAAIQLFNMVDDESKRKEYLVKIRQEIGRINGILSNFLNECRPGSQEVFETFDLAGVADEVEYLLKSEANFYSVDLFLQRIEESLPVWGDSNSIKQVFFNIAKNAFEAMTEGGSLRITLSRHGDHACITFEDNGPGIPGEHLQNIFRPFFTTKLSGTGLGLSISSNIIEKMGGELKLNSRVGEGTAVRIFLPLFEERKTVS